MLNSSIKITLFKNYLTLKFIEFDVNYIQTTNIILNLGYTRNYYHQNIDRGIQ
jgi:hypothetical protein